MTGQTYTVTKRRSMPNFSAADDCSSQIDRISLPAAPFEIPATDRSETAPRGPAICGDLTAEKRKWLRGVLRVRASREIIRGAQTAQEGAA